MDNEPTILLMILVFSVPVLAILSRFATRWRALGTSSREVEQKVERLEKVNAEYAQRLESLEAVVVDRAWNGLQDPGLSEGDRQRRPVATGPHEVPAPGAEEMNTQRVAHLARRIGG